MNGHDTGRHWKTLRRNIQVTSTAYDHNAVPPSSALHYSSHDELDVPLLPEDPDDRGFTFSRKKCLLLTVIACLAFALSIYAISASYAPTRVNPGNRGDRGAFFQLGFAITDLKPDSEPDKDANGNTVFYSSPSVTSTRDGLPFFTLVNTYDDTVRVHKCRDVLCNNQQVTEFDIEEHEFHASRAKDSKLKPLSLKKTKKHQKRKREGSAASSTRISKLRDVAADGTVRHSVFTLVGSDSRPIIVTTTRGERTLLFKCATQACAELSSVTEFDDTDIVLGTMGGAVNSDGVPAFSYMAGSVPAVRFARCVLADCSDGEVEDSIEFPNIVPAVDGRTQMITGADGNPLIITTGVWNSRPVSESDLESVSVTPVEAVDAWNKLVAAGILDNQGVILEPDISATALKKANLYDTTQPESTRDQKLLETSNILQLFRGPMTTEEFTEKVLRTVIVIHCDSRDCDPGTVTYAYPFAPAAEDDTSAAVLSNIYDAELALTASGNPYIASLAADGQLRINACVSYDCQRVNQTLRIPSGGSVVSTTLIVPDSVTHRISFSSGQFTRPLVFYESKGRAAVARCTTEECSHLSSVSSFDRVGKCDIAPCGVITTNTQDGLPFVIFGSIKPKAMHCSNPMCTPYMSGR